MKWYQKTGWIVLLLFVLFPVGLFLMFKYTSWNKVAKFVMTFFFGFVFLINILVAIGINSSSPKTASANASASPKTVSSKVSSSKADFSTAALSEDNVKSSISDSLVKSMITSVQISGGSVTIEVNEKDALSLKSFLQLNQTYSAEAFQSIFKNKNAQTVIFKADVPVSDAYGKTSTVTAQTNTMQRADADKVADWNTFKYESPSQYYSVVSYELATESQVSGIHLAWSQIYK